MIYDENHGPDDPDERYARKNAMYHAHYRSKGSIDALLGEAIHRDFARRMRRYTWMLRLQLVLALFTLVNFIWHPSHVMFIYFLITVLAGSFTAMNPPRTR